MKTDFEYYRVVRKGDDSIPILSEEGSSPDYLYESGFIEKPKRLLFRLGKPVPKTPVMADYLSSPSSIVSEKIYNVLAPLAIEGIQLLPTTVKGKDKELFKNYWAIHIYNSIKCVDTKLSDCVIDDDMLNDVEKLVLDQQVLKGIPLNKRLVFRLKEDFAYQLFHVSIVDKIMKAKPTGVHFINIEEWNEESFFTD